MSFAESMPLPGVIEELSACADVAKMLYTRKESAFALGVSVRSVDWLIARKELAPRRLGKRVLVPAAELEKYAARDHADLTIGGSK